MTVPPTPKSWNPGGCATILAGVGSPPPGCLSVAYAVVQIEVSGEAVGSNGAAVGDASGNGNSGAYAGEFATKRNRSPGTFPAAGVNAKYSIPCKPPMSCCVAVSPGTLRTKSPLGTSMKIAGVLLRYCG